MKYILSLFLCGLLSFPATAQQINKEYQGKTNYPVKAPDMDIMVNAVDTRITVKVIYNALPDGYFVTFTRSFIAKNISMVEELLQHQMDSLSGSLLPLKITKKDITVDVLSLDPLFDFAKGDSSDPIGYRVIQNVTFNIRSLAQMRELATTCLKFGLRDLVNAQAYIIDSKPIMDSIAKKTIQLLNLKKKFCTDAGVIFGKGHPLISRNSEVFYPSERYLKSVVKNAILFKHHVSQSTTMSLDRELDVDNYYDFNLKDADFVFYAGQTGPVVQFYSHFTFGFVREDSEEELRKKITKELEEKQGKSFYIIDKNGSLKKIDVGN